MANRMILITDLVGFQCPRPVTVVEADENVPATKVRDWYAKENGMKPGDLDAKPIEAVAYGDGEE